MDDPVYTEISAQAFHRCVANIIETVQARIWKAGVHDLLGMGTDAGFGQQRGVQTLVLKTRNRSVYLRLEWDTLIGDSASARKSVADAIDHATNALT